MTINTDIDKLFKEGLKDYSEKAPGFIWDNIERTLQRKQARKRRAMLYGMAASIAIVLSFGAGYLFFGFLQDQQPSMAVAVTPSATPVTIVPSGASIENKSNTTIAKPQHNYNTLAIAEKPKQDIPRKSNKAQAQVMSSPLYNSAANYQKTTQYTTADPIVTIMDSDIEIDDDNLEINDANAFTDKEVWDILSNYKMTDNNAGLYMQEDDNKNDPKWSVGINASPLVSYRSVRNIEEESVRAADNISSVTKKYENEQALVSYSAGLDVNYAITKRLNVSSGLYFSEIGQVSTDIPLETSSPYYDVYNSNYAIHTSTGNINVKGTPNDLVYLINPKAALKGGSLNGIAAQGEMVEADFVQSYEYYEIPVMVNYKLIDKKFNVNLSGGVSANIMHGNNTYVLSNKTKYDIDAEVENLNTVNYSGVIGMSMQYPLLKRLHLNLQPLFRYALKPINESETVYPYSFGFYTGLKYNF